MKNKVYMTYGLPASGKTTYCKQKLAENPNKIKRINKDDLRNMLDCGKWSKDNEKFIIQARDILIKLVLEEGLDVIIDDTNLAPKHLEKIDSIASSRHAVIEIVDFTHVSVDECIKRDQKRPNYVGEKIIKKMYNQFLSKPTPRINLTSTLPTAIICDLDGTLALHNGRSPYDGHLCETDSVNESVNNLLDSVTDHVILVSGRPDNCRKETMSWLEINDIDYTHLFMRKGDDKRSDEIVKKEIYNEFIHDKYNVVAVFDDRLRVCRVWHDLGLPIFRVGDPDSDF